MFDSKYNKGEKKRRLKFRDFTQSQVLENAPQYHAIGPRRLKLGMQKKKYKIYQ